MSGHFIIHHISFHFSQPLSPSLLSLDGCKSICGSDGSLWPQPHSVHLGQTLADVTLDPETSFKTPAERSDKVQGFLGGAWAIFLGYFKGNMQQLEEGDSVQLRVGTMTN